MRALRMRTGQNLGCRPRGRPARHPISRALSPESLRRLASVNLARAELAEQATSDLQRRFDEQARELAEARARIAELERLLAEARGEQAEEKPSGRRSDGAQHPDGRPSRDGDGPSTRPQSAAPRPGIMEVRRQLSQFTVANAELWIRIEELELRVEALERRCAELEQQLQRALILAEGREPPASGQPWDADGAARVQERAAILTTELEQVRRERDELARQRASLSVRFTAQGATRSDATDSLADEDAGRTELFFQIRSELQERDRFAQWEAEHRPRETDRRLDPTRRLDEQALVATRTVRWQLMDHAPHSFRQRSRWEIEGILLDPISEQFLIRQSRERIAYRQRIMAAATVPVTRTEDSQH